MAQEIINNGAFQTDVSAESIYESFEKTKNNFSELYSFHTEETGFESRSDTSTTPSQTAATDNPFLLTTNPEGNGGIDLIDAAGNITPRAVGDVITIDVVFTTIVPAGTNLYSVVKLIVNGVIYRATTHNLIKGLGLNDYFSVSWTLPVGADFKTYGGTVYINPLATLLIKDRYIQVTQIHKSK